MSRSPRAMCWGKVRHATEEAATDYRQGQADRRDNPALVDLFNIYRCPICHAWHLGRNRSTRKRFEAQVRQRMAAQERASVPGANGEEQQQ